MNKNMKKETTSTSNNWPNKVKKATRGLLPWLVSGGLVAYVVYTEDMGIVIDALGKGSSPVFFGVVIPFLVFLLFLETIFLLYGFRWFAGVGRFSDLLRARAATYLLTVISIFVGLGGLVIYGKKRYGISYSMGTTIVLNELLHELASQCTLAMLVGILLPAALIPAGTVMQVQAVTTVGMIGVGIYLFILFISRLARYLPEGFRKKNVFNPFNDITLLQYAVFYLVKLVQNILYGFFLAGLLYAFGIKPPIIVCIAFMQIIHLTRAIPVSAFGIGVDQIAISFLFSSWEPENSPGLLLACSLVFTFTLIIGRALLGVPFLKGVFDDLVKQSNDQEPE